MRYLNYNTLLRDEFSERVQKLSINAGFTCPNRDGYKGTGGCTYCNNQSFVPEYAKPVKSVYEQVEEGIDFFYHKYKSQKYLAYFQSYTNTYDSLENLIKIYEEALKHPKVIGIVVGTRPDCVDDDLLNYFAELNKSRYVMIEYGIESTINSTLNFINRGHSFKESEEAIKKTAEKGLRIGAHLILGLPHESREQMLGHAEKISKLPLTSLKLHQLQLIKGTKMARQFSENPEWFHLLSVKEYIDLVIEFLEILNPKIAIERFTSQSPEEMLVGPDWGIKNYEFVHRLNKRMKELDTWQGRLFKP